MDGSRYGQKGREMENTFKFYPHGFQIFGYYYIGDDQLHRPVPPERPSVELRLPAPEWLSVQLQSPTPEWLGV